MKNIEKLQQQLLHHLREYRTILNCKLEPENEKQRKLQNVRRLWVAVIDTTGITDIYSGSFLGKRDYKIDHTDQDLKASGKGFFFEKEGSIPAIREEMTDVIESEVFWHQMKNIMEYRTMEYYRRRIL